MRPDEVEIDVGRKGECEMKKKRMQRERGSVQEEEEGRLDGRRRAKKIRVVKCSGEERGVERER